MRTIIKSNEIYTEGGVLNGYIIFEDNKIIDITEEVPVGEIIDYSKYRVIPGIIDIHNHGFGGWSMTDPANKEDIIGFCKSLATVGVTGVLPTAKEEAFVAIHDVMQSDYEGARIHGIHSEGPFWARGGENTIGMTWPTPSLEETKRLVELANGSLKMMAIAPELENAYDVIKYLHSENIKVACCHTKAKSQQIHDAERKVKLDIATHLGNGMQGIHHRDVGALGALLLENNIQYELIADLNHVCSEMMQLMFKCQPYDKFCLISDSNFMAGLPTGRYIRYDREMFSDEKGLILNSDGRICGSGKWVLSNMEKLEKIVKVPFEEIVKMASLNPAKFLGINQNTGSLTIGKEADIVIINHDYEVLRTYIQGKIGFDSAINKKEDFYNHEAMKKKIAEL
ncbi:N-acetylglucosamine-6-phosphate deacetylase [Anaerorhabdus furcosa]|uniref:N-acetylglucosamine-6-phosphate deacetylase n=1 Tax=Anaerorhabdus furcosa TaxID=118967 RepID=A0A1T4MH40_9FIRM|nr:amidohydrolase family protein [Anaerorhabdus furcosa]SJZ66233.1 N-acetylglucosamine-6-phosphate deacetylase [Anaerorhabdus furcosa]